jgi:class 3 adenylate cyclase
MPATPPGASLPVIRTLLLCDLVASTQLVERLGDAAAAHLLARHDRIARDLLSAFGGREIDKSDGFLLLFERPIGAVRFALAYQAGLRSSARVRRADRRRSASSRQWCCARTRRKTWRAARSRSRSRASPRRSRRA